MNQNSLKTLVLSLQPVYPPMGGAALRNWQNINILLELGEVATFTIGSFKLFDRSASQIKYPGVTTAVNHEVAELDQTRSLVDRFQRKYWKLRPQGHILTDRFYTHILANSLQQLMMEWQPQIVLIEELWFYRYLKIIKQFDCKIIYDSHNINAALGLEINELQHNTSSSAKAKKLQTRVETIEQATCNLCDQIWTCSQEEIDLLQQLYGQSVPVIVIPNGIDLSLYEGGTAGSQIAKDILEQPKTIMYAGTFSYAPNSSAAELLIDRIYPQLQKKYPDCHLLLIGRNPTKHMLEAAERNQNIVVTGTVPNVIPYLKPFQIMVVPLFQGSGTRLKILEAFAAGCPVVSTPKGAEGLAAKSCEHLLLGDEIDDLVFQVDRLWSDPSLAEHLSHNAYQLVSSQYSWQGIKLQVADAVTKLLLES